MEQRIRAARRQGKGIKKIASELGIGVSTVQRVVHEATPQTGSLDPTAIPR
jgi:transposase